MASLIFNLREFLMMTNIHDSELYLYEKMGKLLKNCSIHANNSKFSDILQN